MLFEKFYPTRYYESAYIIDYKSLYDEGYRGIIYDLDNTLVPHGAPADDRAVELLKGLMDMGFKIFFLSNNKEERVKMFNERIGTKYLFKAHKPDPEGFLKAAKMMNCTTDQTLVVGDQLFTDIWGANRAKMTSLLVVPIDRSTDKFQIVLKRQLEKIILKRYKKDHELTGKEKK